MDSILNSLHELSGVSATLVFDVGGKIVARGGRAVQEPELLDQVASTLVKAVDSIQLQHADWEAISAQYADGKVLLRNLGSAAGTSYFLALVSDGTLNVSFAAVAMRVAANKLRKVLGSEAAASAAGPPSANPLAPAADAPLANSGLSWSRVSASGLGNSTLALADLAASDFLARCSRELTRLVGPKAKVLIKESVRRLSPDAPFTLSLAPRLVAELADHISDPSERAFFTHTLSKL